MSPPDEPRYSARDIEHIREAWEQGAFVKQLGEKLDEFAQRLVSWQAQSERRFEESNHLRRDLAEQVHNVSNTLNENQVALYGLKKSIDRDRQRVNMDNIPTEHLKTIPALLEWFSRKGEKDLRRAMIIPLANAMLATVAAMVAAGAAVITVLHH